ncbi:7-cyano-7-deazaguanine synthase [Nonomuraea sp. NPDC049784]|uniref:7-cyano-7-deazaguanine synthase n=1 Tax=Nonomuraea sp. NPDC049784 TaxID=3154361 RepID=UPI003407BE2B
MPDYRVVVNDCAAPPFTRLLQVRCGSGMGITHEYNYNRVAAGLPKVITARQQDWADVLGAIYSIDLACKRGEGSDWYRTIDAWIPVRDPELWNALTDQVSSVFSALTYDRLNVSFIAGTDMSDPPRQHTKAFPRTVDGVALLSGGVDSLVGAAVLLAEGSKPLLLSHMNSPSASDAINKIAPELSRRGAPAHPVTLTARKAQKDIAGENSQRARSLLYMGLGCLIAVGMGVQNVWLNENGVMAVHVPLTTARSGSLSTRTASPRLLTEFSKLASAALDAKVTVQNRLVAHTKPEVTIWGRDLDLTTLLTATVSCWQVGRNPAHCGRCIPCLIRQVSHEYARVPDRHYLSYPFDEIPPDSPWGPVARDNVFHLLTQAVELHQADEYDLMWDKPDLLDSGPGLTIEASVSMHKRWAAQVLEVANAHAFSNAVLNGNSP